MTEQSFKASKPTEFFDGNLFGSAGFDVTADGQRFLIIKQPGQSMAATHLNIVLNWFQELGRK